MHMSVCMFPEPSDVTGITVTHLPVCDNISLLGRQTVPTDLHVQMFDVEFLLELLWKSDTATRRTKPARAGIHHVASCSNSLLCSCICDNYITVKTSQIFTVSSFEFAAWNYEFNKNW